jgi:isopropylmalate/homocitrate/citramalate synthase
VLGKKSGLDSIRIKAEELGLELDEESQRAVLDRVKARGAELRRVLTDDEFRELARTS